MSRNFKKFTDVYSKLKPNRRNKMADYINEANEKGIRFDKTDLYARGFTQKEIEALKSFRNTMDAIYHATNRDMVKTLRHKGYSLFTHRTSDTRLVAKPLARGAVNSKTEYYDVTDGLKKTVGSSKDLDDFYEKGGTFAKLSEPVEVDGVWVDIIRSAETPEGGYLRALRNDDTVLSYREGYYPVQYNSNFFLTKKIRDANGNEMTKVIASAETKSDALKMQKLLEDNDPKGEYDFRPDRGADQPASSDFDDAGWSLGVNAGMSNQKVRGERLKDVTAGLHQVDKTNLVDPLEASANVINALSTRVSMRDWFETSKTRWIKNYAERLGLEKNKYGEYEFPKSIVDIKGRGDTPGQTLADARSAFNYIYTLENGYINGIDQGFKALLNFGADFMSTLNLNKAESALRGFAKGNNIASEFKGAAFKMYLAANPARQALVQSHQTIQLNAINPEYVAGGGLAWDLIRVGRVMRGNTKDEEAVKMLQELKDIGQLDAVDANNLIRDDLLTLAETTFAGKLKSALGKPISVAQKVGFDVGEQTVLVTSYLTHRNLAVKAGKTINTRTVDEIAGKSVSFTYNMNRAGDMPYNQNTLNIIAQFLQVPHKAMLQPFTNRSLTAQQRSQLLAWNTVMYGIPTGVVSSAIFSWMEEGEAKDALVTGMEGYLLNKAFSAALGEEQNIDWSDLQPTDLHGFGEFALQLWTTDLGTLLAESPSGSLFFGNNPRLTNLFTTTARWVHIKDDYDDPALDTKFVDVALAFGNLSSGFSNAFKARYAYKTGLKISSLGNTTDYDVTRFEAFMQGFGFRTETETKNQRAKELLYGSNNTFSETDVQAWYNELKRQLSRRGLTVKDRELAQRVITEGMRVFEDDPKFFRDELKSLVKKDYEKGEFDIIEAIYKQQGYKTGSDLIQTLNALPQSEERDAVINSISRIGEE